MDAEAAAIVRAIMAADDFGRYDVLTTLLSLPDLLQEPRHDGSLNLPPARPKFAYMSPSGVKLHLTATCNGKSYAPKAVNYDSVSPAQWCTTCAPHFARPTAPSRQPADPFSLLTDDNNTPPPDDWRIKVRTKTASAVLVMCLNIGIDPPGAAKVPSP